MINLINADLYRLFRTKAYRNCIIATIIIIVANIVLSGLYFMSITDVNGVRHGFRIGLSGYITYVDLLKNIMGASILMYVMSVCLITSITVARYDSGSLKNIVSYGYERWKIFLANILSLIIGIGILIIVQFIVVLAITFIIIRPEGLDLILTIKTLISYIVIMGCMIGIYATIASVIPSQSIVGVLVICEIMFFSMAGHLLKQSFINFVPLLQLRDLASYPTNLNFIGLLGCMILLNVVVIDIGRMIFNKMEIK